MRALILAAGEGTRLRPLTATCPKPMLPIGGRPMLEHLVALLRRHDLRDIAINLHYRPESIRDHFGDGAAFGVRLTYSPEPKLLSSAGAARRLDWFLDDTFLVLYGDVLTNVDLTALVREHRARRALATLALYRVEDPTRCGVVGLAEDGRVVSFVEKPPLDSAPSNLANAGIYVLEPSILRQIPPDRPWDFGADVFPGLVAAGTPIYGVETPGYILDIGSPERYAQAEADYRSGRFASPADVEVAGMRGGAC